MADQDETLTAPVEVDGESPTPDAIASADDLDVDSTPDVSESDDLQSEGGPEDASNAESQEPSDTEGDAQSDDDDRPVTRREQARENERLRKQIEEAIQAKEQERLAKEDLARSLEQHRKSQEELEKDFFELVGTDDEFREADRLSRYSDDPYEREEALRKYEQLAKLREKLPRAWLWYVGKMAGADVQKFATETNVDAGKLLSAPNMEALLKVVRDESVGAVEKQWKAKYDALTAKYEAEKKAHDAARARAGSATPSPERGGRPSVGKGPTLEEINAMPWQKKREYLSTDEGKSHYNALTRRLMGVA